MDNNGDLWFISGQHVNYIWKYSRSLNQWVWVKGENTFNPVVVYETQGVPSTTAKQGHRIGHAVWMDAAGNFHVFGEGGISVRIAPGVT